MGNKKYIDSPERMWELFELYRTKIKSNPIQIVEQKKGTTILPKGLTPEEFREFNSSVINLPAQRPLTMEGFENYCADEDVIEDLGDYFSNRNEKYTEFSAICRRIKRTIRQDQIEGGMAGIYNPSITQRLNNLVDKVQEDGTKKVIITVVDGDTSRNSNA